MIQFAEIPGSKKAMNPRNNVPIGVANALIDILTQRGFKVDGCYVCPVGYGNPSKLVSVEDIADLPQNEPLFYMVGVSGTPHTAASLWRNIQIMGEPLAMQMLADELKYGS